MPPLQEGQVLLPWGHLAVARLMVLLLFVYYYLLLI